MWSGFVISPGITDLQRATARSAITPYAYDTVTDHESALPLSRVFGLFLKFECVVTVTCDELFEIIFEWITPTNLPTKLRRTTGRRQHQHTITPPATMPSACVSSLPTWLANNSFLTHAGVLAFGILDTCLLSTPLQLAL